MRKRIIATLVLVFVFFAIFQVIQSQAAAGVNVNIYLNITPGTLGITAGPDVALADWAFDPNAGTNSGGNLTKLNVWDTRGSAAGWTVSAWSNSLTATNAAPATYKNTIANTAITIRGGTEWNVSSSSETGLVVNTTNQTLNTPRTVWNAGSGYGSGNYFLANSMIVATVSNNSVAGLYGCYMTLTVA